MDQTTKRQKVDEDSIVNDIASSLRELSTSITSISQRYSSLLKVNKAVVLYMQNAQMDQTSPVDEIESSLKETTIGQE